MSDWICSSCGSGGATVLDSRPSLSDHLAVGYCIAGCSPIPVYDPRTKKTKPLNRAVVQLVASDRWDPDVLRRRREAKRERKLLDDVLAGRFKEGSAQYTEALEIRARWDAEAEARRSA